MCNTLLASRVSIVRNCKGGWKNTAGNVDHGQARTASSDIDVPQVDLISRDRRNGMRSGFRYFIVTSRSRDVSILKRRHLGRLPRNFQRCCE